MEFILEDGLKLVLAVMIGGVIGAEREMRDKAAGIRTMVLICAGAALFTIFSQRFSGDVTDASRVASNVVTGVGFLGAGVILRDRGRVLGLTTAATVWIAAALGMGIGAGQYAITLAATAIVAAVLWLFRSIEGMIARRHTVHTYRLRFPRDDGLRRQFQQDVSAQSLTIRAQFDQKADEEMICEWEVTGSPTNHTTLFEQWLANDTLREVVRKI